MNRQELLINLVLLTIVGVLGFLIYENRSTVIVIPAPKESKSPTATTKTETGFNAELAQAKYPKFGEVPVFKALLTPTPTPPPPTPAPTPTPNIHTALGPWGLMMLDAGVATIEDKSRKEDNVFEIKLNESRPVQADKEVKNVTLIRFDPDEDGGNPSVTFKMDGAEGEEHTIKMIPDEPSAPEGKQ